MDQIRSAFLRAGMVRPYRDRWLAGVCAGTAHRLGTEPWVIRLALLLLTVLPGSAALVYLVLWLCMPPEGWTPPAR